VAQAAAQPWPGAAEAASRTAAGLPDRRAAACSPAAWPAARA